MRIPHSSIPGILSPAIPGRMAALLMSVLYQLEQTQWLGPEELIVHQCRQLSALFAHAGRSVPFYQRRFAEAGVDPAARVTPETIARLPILSRQELQGAGDSLLTGELPKSHGKMGKIETPGSTGTPVRLCSTEITRVFWRACVMREHLWAGRELTGKLAAIRWVREGVAMPPEGARSDGWGPASASIYPTGPAVLLNIASKLQEQVDWLRRAEPDYLISFPSNLAALATYCLENGLGLNNLKQIVTVGEALPDNLRDLVQRAWDVPLKDSYSCEEAGYLAIQCPEHDVHHVQSENVFLEVVDGEDRPCAPGEAGRVLVTSLHNFATPLIRYELGDYVRLGKPCACGRGLPVIEKVLGRKRNRLILPDGRAEFPDLGAQDATAKVRASQYIQRSPTVIEKLMVVSEPLTEAEEAAEKARIVKNFGHPFEIRLTYVDKIPKRGAGKFEAFLSEVAV